MTRMTGPDCVVMCNLINKYIHTYIHTYIHAYIHRYSIERDWPPCKVVFRVGNQNTNCDKQQQSYVFVLLHRVQIYSVYRELSLY